MSKRRGGEGRETETTETGQRDKDRERERVSDWVRWGRWEGNSLVVGLVHRWRDGSIV